MSNKVDAFLILAVHFMSFQTSQETKDDSSEEMKDFSSDYMIKVKSFIVTFNNCNVLPETFSYSVHWQSARSKSCLSTEYVYLDKIINSVVSQSKICVNNQRQDSTCFKVEICNDSEIANSRKLGIFQDWRRWKNVNLSRRTFGYTEIISVFYNLQIL